MKPTQTLSMKILSLFAVGTLGLASGCGPSRGPGYQFESQSRPVLAAAGVAPSKHPKLAVTASGTVYMLSVYGGEPHARLGLAVSHNGGDTFQPLVPISAPKASVRSHGENSPSLAVAPASIYALWEQAGAEGNTELMFARSLSFGHSFELPIRVTDKSKTSFNGFSSLGVAPNGDVYAVWLDGRDEAETPGTFSVYVARSTDRGATFGKNSRVAGSACPCCRPRVAFGNHGELFVFWRRVYPDDIRDMTISTSTDGGQTFAPPARVAVDNWKINGCPDSGPATVRSGNRLYVAWLTEATRGGAGVKLSWSDDGGKTFAAPLLASAPILDANHPALAVSEDGKVLLVYQGRDPAGKQGWSPLRPYVVEVNSEGHASVPTAASSNQRPAAYPTLAVGGAGRVFLAWTESGETGNTVQFLRGRKIP